MRWLCHKVFLKWNLGLALYAEALSMVRAVLAVGTWERWLVGWEVTGGKISACCLFLKHGIQFVCQTLKHIVDVTEHVTGLALRSSVNRWRYCKYKYTVLLWSDTDIIHIHRLSMSEGNYLLTGKQGMAKKEKIKRSRLEATARSRRVSQTGMNQRHAGSEHDTILECWMPQNMSNMLT